MRKRKIATPDNPATRDGSQQLQDERCTGHLCLGLGTGTGSY